MPVADIDLSALTRNAARLRRRAQGGADLLVAVKADAYGHGLIPVARALAREGVSWFGVATADEAWQLRRAGVPGRVLIFGPLRGTELRRALASDADLTVCTDDDVDAVRAAQAERREAAMARPRLHLNVDTGMARLGQRPAEARAVADRIDADDALTLEGAWTHLACADDLDADVTDRQLDAFDRFLADLARDGIRPTLRHAANSAGLLAHPRSHYDLVRSGIAAYGCCPGLGLERFMPEFEPVLRLTAPVTFVKRVRSGESVSYGHRWTAPKDVTVATVRIGYADGYPRALSNRGEASLHGRTVQVAGTVCMDQLMLDAGDAQVDVGDRVVLLGPGGPSAESLATRIGTIPYDLVTRVGGRVLRRYRLDG
ncbi:MAG: alanine racemase [Trueperaceae bacterium]